MRQLQKGPHGDLLISWVRPTDIPIEARNGNYVAILKGLMPGQPWTVRIIPLQANGEAGNRLFTIEFYTPEKSSLVARLTKPSLTQLLLIALLVLLGWQAWQRWGHRRSA
jgi:hypothetical protein